MRKRGVGVAVVCFAREREKKKRTEETRRAREMVCCARVMIEVMKDCSWLLEEKKK